MSSDIRTRPIVVKLRRWDTEEFVHSLKPKTDLYRKKQSEKVHGDLRRACAAVVSTGLNDHSTASKARMEPMFVTKRISNGWQLRLLEISWGSCKPFERRDGDDGRLSTRAEKAKAHRTVSAQIAPSQDRIANSPGDDVGRTWPQTISAVG